MLRANASAAASNAMRSRSPRSSVIMKATLSAACAIVVLVLGVAIDAAAYGRHHGGYRGGHHSGHHYRDYGHRGHRRHSSSHFNLHFGAPLFWGRSPYYRRHRDYYYEPRTVIIEREPPVYIQRQPVQQAQQAQATQLWYYCPNPAGYYPHIASCSQQWVPVDPRTVPPTPSVPPQ